METYSTIWVSNPSSTHSALHLHLLLLPLLLPLLWLMFHSATADSRMKASLTLFVCSKRILSFSLCRYRWMRSQRMVCLYSSTSSRKTFAVSYRASISRTTPSANSVILYYYYIQSLLLIWIYINRSACDCGRNKSQLSSEPSAPFSEAGFCLPSSPFLLYFIR